MANGNLTLVLDEADYRNMVGWLNNLSDVDQTSVVNAALRGGMKTIIDEGRINLNARNNVKTGNLKKSFSISVHKKKQNKAIRGFALGGFKLPQGAHAHLVDKGTAKRWTEKGYYRGSVSKDAPNKGSGFFSEAVESKGEEALDKLINTVYEEILRITDRHQR